MFSLFRKDDPDEAVRQCVNALEALMDELHRRSNRWDEDIWRAQVKRRLVDAGAGVFLWGFLDVLASRSVRSSKTRWLVTTKAFETVFGFHVAGTLSVEAPDRAQGGLGRHMFRDGQQAAKAFLRGDRVPAVHTLMGLMNLGSDVDR